MNIFFIFCFSVATSLMAQSDDTTEFKTFFATYAKAYAANPAKTLHEGAASDYQIIAGDGIIRSLEETAQVHGSVKNLKLTFENEKYRVYGNTGIVTGTAYYSGEFGGGNSFRSKHLFTYVFAKGKDGWKQVSAQHLDLNR
ncbi:hypothetical protein GCM10028807_08510 [Spirosoma daeguense]